MRACAKMLQRLDGEEAIRLMNITALATGNLEKEGVQRLLELFTAMSEGRPVPAAAGKDPARITQQQGIKVRLIPTARRKGTPRKSDGTGTRRPRRT